MLKEENYIVSKKHSLIMLQYDLDLIEQKLICWLACKVQPSDKEFKNYNLSIKDFIKGLGTKNQMKYTTLPEVAKNLMKKVFEIKEQDGTTHALAFLSSASYKKGSGTISLEFSPKLKPYLLDLQGLYVQYKLWNVLKLKNRYSLRMYEYLKSKQNQHENKKPLKVNIVDLKKYINCTEKSYNLYGNFNLKILKSTQKELELLTDIKFSYKPIKQGAKITGLQITIHKNKIPQISGANELYDQIQYDETDLYKKAAEDEIAAELAAAKEDPGEDEAKEYNIKNEVDKLRAAQKNK